MGKFYDVNFTLEECACFLVEARSKAEAREIAEKELDKMSKRELMGRIWDAIEYGGLKIKSIERAD